MELAFITLRFDSPEEQKYVEDHVAYLEVWEREIWDKDSGNQSWTEFYISGCEPHDVQEALDEVMAMWENHKDDEELEEDEDYEKFDGEKEFLENNEMPWDYGKHFE